MNSDRIYWQKKPDGSLSQVNVEKSSIGQRISTKAVGSDARVDITHLYKYPEGNKTNTSGPKPRAAFLEIFLRHHRHHRHHIISADIDTDSLIF